MVEDKDRVQLALLKNIKGQTIDGVFQRVDDGVVEIHTQDYVVQVRSIKDIYVSTMLEKVKW